MHPAREISIKNFCVGGNQPLALIAGPCMIESEAHAFMMAERLAEIAAQQEDQPSHIDSPRKKARI